MLPGGAATGSVTGFRAGAAGTAGGGSTGSTGFTGGGGGTGAVDDVLGLGAGSGTCAHPAATSSTARLTQRAIRRQAAVLVLRPGTSEVSASIDAGIPSNAFFAANDGTYRTGIDAH
jgi:hypothetical protein